MASAMEHQKRIHLAPSLTALTIASISLLLQYRDLPIGSYLSLTVWELAEGRGLALVGCSCMPLFNKKGRLKTGQQKLKIHEGLEAPPLDPSTMLGKVTIPQRSQIGQLEHLMKLYARGDMPHVDWLDTLTFKEITRLQEAEAEAVGSKQQLQLVIDLPVFPHAVLYQQASSPASVLTQPTTTTTKKEVLSPVGSDSSGSDDIILLHDPEVGWENPAELKAAKLARSLTRGVIDRDLKPNSDERRRIAAVLRLPPNKPLHADDRALLWRFRFSLTGDKRALTKFLKCVDWSDAQEAKQAAELMQQWAPIEVADALELLSPDFKNDEVRSHAVSVLQRKDDDELLYYLLQLVQALRFEVVDLSRLARFLISRATNNPAFATFLHWYVFTEWEDPSFGPRASAVHAAFVNALTSALRGEAVWEAIRRQTDMVSQLAYIIKEVKGSRLKAARATERMWEMLSENGPCSELTSSRVPLPLNPHILLEGLVPSECSCFKSAQLPVKLSYRVSSWPIDWDSPVPLARSGTALAPATSLNAAAGAAAAGALPMADVDVDVSGQHSVTLPSPAAAVQAPPLPHRTAIVLKGEQLRCVMIYKKGDDLRQDQFILQMISLMDSLLKRENLDLRLTPYKVLPTSSDDGLVEFVPSAPLSRILAEHRTIHRYLAQTQAESSGPFGLKAEALETFVRSCAGYCVMTYILGVGDRHLDNLMLAPDGRLFHIDFGYILGNDPKPFPPPMKICKEMVEAMGGQDSSYYVQFRMYSCEAYNILRKNADLILSLFHLMAGASIEAIRINPENAMLKLQEKLRLDFDDEQAVEWMQQLINESATALMPQIVETTHRWAQYWR
eukprot:jgi/Chrzof1/12023/Cz06g18140.t1